MLSEVSIPIPNLPQDLDGLRIVQITDIHLSAFLSEREFAAAIDMANETRASLALVTGDLITRRGDPLDACLRQLARLRAEAGVLGCLGNHEIYAGAENYVTEQGRRIGIEFLRHQSKQLRFGNATINFAGVDYQRMHSRYLRRRRAADRSWRGQRAAVAQSRTFSRWPPRKATISPLPATRMAARWISKSCTSTSTSRAISRPLYTASIGSGNSSVYVSNGLGTIGVPVRLGAPPEVSVLRLCAI